jgi:hypothetical protein
MTLSEPSTMLTDYALTLLCGWFALTLYLRSEGRRLGLWIAAFGVTAFAALAGGTAHGFRIPLGDAWAGVWRVTVASIAASSALLIAAGFRSALRPETADGEARRRGRAWLKRAIGVSLLGLAVLVRKLAPHPAFNHNDLYHVIQMGGLYCLYRGAALLHGISESGT